MKRLLFILALLFLPCASSAQMTAVSSGAGNNQTIAVTSANQFQLLFAAYDNWGIEAWYDLVNDPSKTTNLLVAYSVAGQSIPCILQNGLANMILYGYNDASIDTHFYSNACGGAGMGTRSATILSSTPFEVVLQTVADVNDGSVFTYTVTYWIFWDGRIYVDAKLHAIVAKDLTEGGIDVNYVIDMALNDPAGGSSTGTTSGWVRNSTTQQPYGYVAGVEDYLYAYWDHTDPNYPNFTKASIMQVNNPNNAAGIVTGQFLHGWACGTGCGTQRWGYASGGIAAATVWNMAMGQTNVMDYMLQLGTEGSTILPNLRTTAVAGPIANAYRANPVPAPVISPFAPIVSPSGTTAFSCVTTGGISCGSGGTWTCANASNGGTCLGSINSSSGVYTAPVSLAASQSLGGYQLLPNDHIFNTNIASLPTRADSATLIAGAGTVPVNYLPSFRFNYTDGSTPTDNMNFYYTPANNASFQSPAWPNAIEGGWFDSLINDGNVDHHFITIDTTNGNLSERYQFYAQAPVTSCAINSSNSGTCTFTPTTTSPGFPRAAALGRQVNMGGWTAGDTYLNGLFTLTGATSTTFTFNIAHATASTSTSGQASLNTACPTCNSQSGVQYTYKDYLLPPNAATDAAGMLLAPLTLHTQEVVNACANASDIKHALRMSLQNGYLQPTLLWPATTFANAGAGANYYGERLRLKSSFAIGGFSACAQKLLTQMKNYGLIIADGGYGWQIQFDFDNTTAAAVNALTEINNANIATSNWEVVDESSLMEAPFFGAANNGEIVTYTSSTGTATSHVDLQGTALSASTHQYYIMAGTPQQQLTFYSNGAFTCAMSPTVGSITSDCKYTPPSSEASVTTTTVTATSSANGAVKARMIVYVTPATIRLIQATADFVDSNSNTWYSGGAFGVGMSNIPTWQGCCQTDNEGSFSGTDKQLYWNHLASSQTAGDFKMDFHVPAGTYKVTFNNGTQVTVGADVRYFYAQGALIATVDSTAAAGGLYKNWSLTANVTVGGNNTLSFYNAGIGGQTNNTGDVSSISIEQIAAAATAAPKSGTILLP